ncbi:E3 ubiquitin-protein ligase rnf213-alpha-like [Salarias fasciatus]|uniref:E3 ubiquitin-protein ligase rnf213-alpha-like n=1 Tax=Salarias fasciatus TaxID=181472 RepID=UPI00117677F0|nr:E3 ubiquitin-protein ligase rnf213-alpha-like [Salarias fasciatus]
MKCTACGHQILEKTPKFCSECGKKLSVQPAVTEEAGDQLKPLITDSESNTEKSGSQQDDQHVDNKESNRPNDESISDIKEETQKKTEDDQSLNTTPADPLTPRVDSEEKKNAASQAGTGEETKTSNPKQRKSKTDAVKQDRNASVEQTTEQTEESKTKGKSQQGKRTKQTAAAQQKMVYGRQTPSKPDSIGSSVDPVAAEDMGPQQSGSEEEQTQTSDDDSEQEDSSPKPPPPPTKQPRPSHTAPSERLNIYFHAVLSKDFKFVPGVDRVFVNMVSSSGKWEEEAVELSVKRNLQEHGFLIEGCLKTTKNQVSKSIPYKYFVYKTKKGSYKYEYIYKQDSTQPANRCLFVKEHLINENGDWHQYDDIICAPPSKNVVKRTWDNWWSEQRKSLIQGREIAGRIMLGTIFGILRDWTETNLRSFISQLYQFFQVYKDPYVYEERPKKWSSLNYGEENVTDLLKDCMLTAVIPQLSDRNRKGYFIQDDFKAAVIMLHVRGQYRIKLYRSELQQLCAMLCLPKLEKDRFLQFWEDFSKEVSVIRSVPETLVDVINIVKKENMPEWIMALPLLHLLNGTTKPFERPPPGNPQPLVSWAGLQGLDIGRPRNMSSQDRRALLKVMTNNSHLVEVDPLSVRSCLYFMSLDELRECSSNLKAELLDILEVFTKRAPAEITANSHEAVSGLLSHIKENLDQERYSDFTEAYRIDCLSAAVRLLDKICKGVKPTYTQNYPDIPVACMHLVASVTDFVQCNKQQESREQDGVQQHVRELVISQAMGIMREWMSRTFKQLLNKGFTSLWHGKATDQFETWNNIISISFKDEDFTTEWEQTFKMDFEGKYKKESPQDQIDFYCNYIEVLKDSRPHLAASVENCALEAVTHLCQTKSEGKVLEKFKINPNFGKLASAIIQKTWPLDSQGKYQGDEEVVLRHLLSWTAAKDIFQLHGADQNLAEQLSQDARDIITIAISSFIAITDQLVQGNLKISLLKIILEQKDVFLALIQTDFLSNNESYKDNGKMKWLLQCRHDELESIYHEKELVDVLFTLNHKLEDHITVDVADIMLKRQVNIECASLNEFMEVHRYDQRQPEMAGVVTYFSLDEEIREMAEVLHKFRDSYVFKKCWDQQAKLLPEDKVKDDPDESQVADMVTLKTIHEKIFMSCFDHFKDIYVRLRDGTIRLEEVNQLFKDVNDNYEKLQQEIDIMCKVDNSQDKLWINSRMQQIKQYHELHLAVASAQIIMKVKDTLCLQGDFSVLETLTKVNQVDFEKEQLKRIDDDLMQAKKILVDITEPRRLCLQELGRRGQFVKWAKEALEDINELKVFVDLASISAGENDMDVDRVACFHDAVLGYSSMLYELKPDSGFDAFKEMLKKLWKALDNDSNLCQKLRDTARHLEWLKMVKDSHGSVELSSLSLASTINHKGIYLISPHGVEKLSLKTALKLQIPEELDEGPQMRCYSLEDLRELQNKLMLMSGKGDKGQNEVEHFAEVFASVQRLAEAFIALYNAGNPLFRHWKVQINCFSDNQLPSIMMDFNLDRVPSVTIDGGIEEQLPELCRKMEKCLKYWMDFVNKQRSQNYYLNYYTAEQIVYLCSKLTQQNVTSIEDQVLMMLSFIKPNCTTTDLEHVWHTLQDEIITKPQERNEDLEFQTFVILPRSSTEDQELDSQLSSLPSLVEQTNGLQAFDQIWNAYMKDMKDFLPHVLDIKSLGRLLEILANKSDKNEDCDSKEDNLENNFIQRQLPKGLATGRPNLIVCPHDEVLTSCISVYMNSETVTLPTYDEVLLCSPSTPYEQVELFLRRCLSEGYRGQKIYSLLYGDLLTYDVSSKLESFFQEMKMKSRHDYQLVLICSSEREHAYLPSAFSQYRLHMVPQESLARIQRYLHKHYAVPKDQCSAAAVFKDRLCVGIISSKRAGVGKSLYIKRLYEKLKSSTTKPSAKKCIRLIEPCVDENTIVQSLLERSKGEELTMFHFDVMSSVQKGLAEFLFKLLILRYLMDSEGKLWKCNDKQLYVIEILEPTVKLNQTTSNQAQILPSTFTDVFPKIVCRPPKDVLMLEMRKREDPTVVSSDDPLMDEEEFRSEAFQRPYQYLTRFHNGMDLDAFSYQCVEGSHVECLQMLLMNCGIMDPSWAELRNFAWFLNLQLRDCETSVFCDATFTGDTLSGFKTFVVDFMILMAKDFATPSLNICDQSPGRLQMDLTGVKDEDLAPFLIRKRWETEPHPYIFFNDDHVSMTFIGFHLQLNEQGFVDAIEPTSGRVIKKNVMTKALYEGLTLQRVPFNINFDSLPRGEKIERICNVLGIQWPLDPDETYELTTDNILKILAIHMRFRCGIPVIIMGETGCGKTRLIKFLCELRKSGVATENMKLVKVHGGTTSENILSKVREAENVASINKADYGLDTVLFFDEANTTEAISSIKEVLCDNTVKGESLTTNSGLQIIAACNPYRKHTDEMIQRLESAGLGYRVRADETDEKLGSIPLRQLVYRVQALPPSMIPLVWDFGQLNEHTEKKYIQQIVQRVIETKAIDAYHITMITNVLSASQKYMRTRRDECSFVSLRDVERCMQVFVWFYDNHAKFFAELEELEKVQKAQKKERHHRGSEVRDPVVWSLVMATGVCYHACLEDKDQYRQKLSSELQTYSPAGVMQEISLMQDLLLNGVPMGDTIARNNALKENVFMMVLCIELRIPLFLVGKPGSSKSLSKTLVADAMQGQAAHSDLYKRLKQIHLVSFQCSPHSTPEGIINTFKQCGRFQEGKNLGEYISVVVLDEIGLAEDSPKMPLKTLHPLLEEGCIDDEPLPHKKVGFIGISNWALDPAKMNRGIFVSRGDPDQKELIESARGICSSDAMVLEKVSDFFEPFARAYLHICHSQGKGFFGLRDYYSLIKMFFAEAKASQRRPTAEETAKAVLRNFSGKDDVDAVTVFTTELQITPNLENLSAFEFVRENLHATAQDEECRYLLVLTKNYAALQILQQTFFSESVQPEIIFGSSFPKDQEYTQICRNINRVKICMETGQTVVLLNLQNLYESLYDALNQYYVCLGGQKYVDLGLGTHRVKCRVHQDFRLIVIEEREVVYKQFPIPLINRLEKHYLDIHTVLRTEQKRIVEELEKWVTLFVTLSSQFAAADQTYKYQPPDVFIGYHSDACASVVLEVTENQKANLNVTDAERNVLDEAKLVLLKCATPDSVVRLDRTGLPKVESEELAKIYFEEQSNNCLADYILSHTRQEVSCHAAFTEVTTFSRLLTAIDLELLKEMFHSVELLSLQQFDTEHSFLKKIRNFLTAENGSNIPESCNKILIIQCDYDDSSHGVSLIASAKYSSINEINKITQERTGCNVFVYFITRLPRIEGGTTYIGFHGGPWRSVHIDDLRRSKDIVSDIKTLQNMAISKMFETKMMQQEAMEVDDNYTEAELEETTDENDDDCVVDTTLLLRSCVQSAVSMMKDNVESGSRSNERVEILLTFLSDSDEMKEKFLETVKRRLHSLLLTQDGNTSSVKSNWVLNEATNIDALQEGGTFRHTLWKRVQAAVSPLLAYLVSVIDRDRNMDILLDGNSGETVKKLWLDIFANDKLLEMSNLTVDRNFEKRTFLVQNYITQNKNFSCSMPFSWRIKDFLEELWVQVLQHEGHTQQKFDEFFWKTPLGRYIAEADPDMQMEFFHRYLQDFICMTMTISCPEDLQLLCNALNCCVNEMKVHQEEAVVSLPWVHAAYHKFKIRLQNLSRMICIEPQVTHDLRNLERDGVELVHDVSAAFACVEHLEPKVLDIDAQRLAWLRDVKKLQVPIDLVCSEDSVRHYGEKSKMLASRVQAGWNRIYSLSLYVEHMLLGIEELEMKLAPVVLESTRRLGKVLEKNSDLKTQQSFEAVIDLLKKCKDEVVQRIFRFGLTQCPVCMGDPKDPLCLPCEHIFCVDCIKQWLGPGQMYCPFCMQQVEDDFLLVPTEETRKSVNLHAQFRKRCNAFFIDLVSTVCFKDNSPPCSQVIFHLLSFLMTEASPVPILRANPQVLTKALSPFDDSVDKNPVIRSVVLKLLLKYSFDEVKDYLQQHLMTVEQSNILEDTDKLELYCLYINCLEDSMFDRLQFRSAADQQEYLQEESHFLTEFLQSQSPEAATVEFFQQVTRVRMDLDLSASLFVEEMRAPESKTESQSGTTAFMTSVVNLCRRSGNDWYRVYLIRKICSQHGVEFVLKLLKVEEMRWLFPEILQKNEEAFHVDQYLVCGEDYKVIRDAVGKGFMEGKTDELDEACEGCGCPPQWKTVYLLLALYREVTTLYRDTNTSFHPKPEQVDALQTYIQTSKILASNESKTFAQCLVTNQLGPLVLPPGASSADCVSVDLTVHLAAVLVCANQGILGPLLQLAKTPANMQGAFLPTMPEDMLAVAHQALGALESLQWYQCQNGHPCTIGECGRPWRTSTCLDCGVPIGGRNHIALQGFQHVNVQGDRTQTGHILGDPRRRQNPDMLDTKSISPVPFTIIRMITHMAMLLGAYSHPQSISAIIKPPVGDTGAFLLAHLREDMKHLIRSLGKGTDDTISVFHLLINSLLEPQQQQKCPVPYDDVLSDNKTRNGWEEEMSSIISVHLKHLDRQLKEATAFIRADSRISANSVVKLIFGDPRQFLASLPTNSVIHGSAVWTCREKVSLLSLTHIVEQNDGKDTLPVLWRFLHKEAEIRLVKHLPDVLALQRDLVKKFQNTEVTFFSIEEFLGSHEAVSLKAWYKKHIRIFLTTWNQLRVSLETNGEIKIPAEFCQKDLDVKSDFRVLLPQRQGPGLCSTALVSYLIALHNNLIYGVDKNTGEETSYKVSPADLTDLHVIHYEMERDVMPLILANTQYSIERGQETIHEYNLPKIQQQIISRFLQGKPFITLNGIPTLVNRHDRNYEIILKDVKTKIRQEPLQALTLVAVAGDLRSYSDVCEALHTLEVALGFLAMTGGEPHMQLSCYLEEVLQMGNQMAQHVLKALSVCCLKHCVALWQLLASLKSENMLQLKKDPFPDSEEYKQPLGEEERRLLAGFFSKNRADVFLLEMHEFLVLVLKNPKAPETFRPDWSLKETLVAYMERKDMDVPPEVEEHFPEEISLAHYVEAWKFIVDFKNERGHRQ